MGGHLEVLLVFWLIPDPAQDEQGLDMYSEVCKEGDLEEQFC
jgi:hypothetical protein